MWHRLPGDAEGEWEGDVAAPTRGEARPLTQLSPDPLTPYRIMGPAGHMLAEEDEAISVEICWCLCRGRKAVRCWDGA